MKTARGQQPARGRLVAAVSRVFACMWSDGVAVTRAAPTADAFAAVQFLRDSFTRPYIIIVQWSQSDRQTVKSVSYNREADGS